MSEDPLEPPPGTAPAAAAAYAAAVQIARRAKPQGDSIMAYELGFRGGRLLAAAGIPFEAGRLMVHRIFDAVQQEPQA